MEARCMGCGETFIMANEADVIHIQKEDGTACGGIGVTRRQRKGCPDCGATNLYSSETATVEYPIVVAIDGTWDYTGEESRTYDEGTEFVDQIACRCGWLGALADLVDTEETR